MGADGKRAVIYARLSKDKGKGKGKADGSDAEGLGVARQERACRDLATVRGWTVAQVYADNDTSAWSGVERPKYEAMLQDAAKGRFDHVIAWAPDRLSRNLEQTLVFAKAMASAGVEVHTVTSGQVGLGEENAKVATVLQALLGEVESDRRSKRLREKMAENARNGKPHGGTRGYGYTSDMKIVKAEADVIRDVKKRLLGGEGISSVVADLNEHSVPGASGKAGVWTTSTLKTIMCSPRIAGLRQHNSRAKGERNNGGLFREGDLYKATWTGIITPREGERLRAKLDDDRKRRSPARAYPLTGLLVCGRCGGRLVGHRYADEQRGYACRCHGCTVKAEPVEGFILREVRGAIRSGELAQQLSEHADGDLPAALESVQEVRDDLSGLYADYRVEKVITREQWQSARGVLEDRLRSAEARVDALETASGPMPPVESVRAWDRAWRGATSASAQTALLSAVLEKVTVGRGTPGRRFQPERFTLTWLR